MHYEIDPLDALIFSELMQKYSCLNISTCIAFCINESL